MTDFPSSPVSATLKPCPFCGGKMEEVTDEDGHYWVHPGRRGIERADCWLSDAWISDEPEGEGSIGEWNTRADGVAPSSQEQLVEAGRAAIVIRNELDRVRADRDYQADLAERWKAQFDSAAAAASEYSEFWEKHCRDFDQFGNYVPYSQMDGDLRAAKRRIAELEAALSNTSTEGNSK